MVSLVCTEMITLARTVEHEAYLLPGLFFGRVALTAAYRTMDAKILSSTQQQHNARVRFHRRLCSSQASRMGML